MMNDLQTINTNDYETMAKAMGIANEKPASTTNQSTLARVKIQHSPLMGKTEVNGKEVNVEVVEGGTYKVEIPNGASYYGESATIRPFMQRFMYKKYVMGTGGAKNRYVKTVMSDNLNIDLKDNDGTFNCGKPSGWIDDFNSLPQKTKDLIKAVKRVRVVFGNITLKKPTDGQGNSIAKGVKDVPFIWEIDNRDAFKSVGKCFIDLAKSKRLPIQHVITLGTQSNKMNNGNVFYTPAPTLDMTKTLDISQPDQEMFGNLKSWIENYNTYIINAWNENVDKHETVDKQTVEDFIDIDTDEIPQ